MTSKTPCRYFQQGRCNRGNSCKFAHVYSNGNSGGTGQGNASSMSEAELLKSFINPSSIPKIDRTVKNDMKDADNFQLKPVTSAYSYGAPCAVNLISGRDYSLEESRVEYYRARNQATIPQYETQINARESDMKECIKFTTAHTDWAARYLQVNTKQLVETGRRSTENEFINFPLDLTGAKNVRNTNGSFGGAFGQPAFGQPAFGSSTFGSSTFGSSAFGQSSSGQSSFGQSFGNKMGSSSFGSPSFGSPSFGSPSFGSSSGASNFGNNTFGKPAFGDVSGSNQSAFGKPGFGSNAFGSNAFGSSAFGSSAFGGNMQQSSSGNGSAFGKPSFGSNTMASAGGSSAFGQPSFGSQTSSNSIFGKPSFQMGNTTAGPQSGNGINIGTTGGTSAQGSSNSFGSAGGQTSAFGQPSFKSLSLGGGNSNTHNSSPFGSSAFKQSNSVQMGSTPFGAAAPSNSPFASLKQNQPQNKSSSFIQPQSQTQYPASENTQNSSVKGFGFGSKPHSSVFSNIPNSSISQPRTLDFIQGLPTDQDKLKVEELDQKTLEHFKMEHFNLGEVPDIPPPLELAR